jgi:integrase
MVRVESSVYSAAFPRQLGRQLRYLEVVAAPWRLPGADLPIEPVEVLLERLDVGLETFVQYLEPVEREADLDEVNELLGILSGDDKVIYAVAALAGLRVGELRPLRWLDVTLHDGDGPPGGWVTVSRAWDGTSVRRAG